MTTTLPDLGLFGYFFSGMVNSHLGIYGLCNSIMQYVFGGKKETREAFIHILMSMMHPHAWVHALTTMTR